MKFAVLSICALMIAQGVSAETLTFDAPLSGWTTDRRDPASFGITTISGNKVLTIGIDGSQQDPSSFYNYQGNAHAFPLSGGSQSYSIDQYVDTTAWAGQSINAGFWGVGVDGTSTVSAYPIIAYRQSDMGAFAAGYYSFDYQVTGDWEFLGAASSNAWNNLKIELTPGVGMAYSINGTQLGSTIDPATTNLSDVILNTYNFGNSYQVSYDNLSASSVTPLPSAALAGGLLLGGLGITRRRRHAA